jgi:hypothetical protein
MMKKAYQILPVILYKWLARKYCERVKLQDVVWRIADTDILIKEK